MSDEKETKQVDQPKALWQIADEIAMILYAPSDSSATARSMGMGEETEDASDELDAKLEELNIQFDEKIVACVKAIKNRRAESKMIAAEMKSLRAMKQVADNNIERLTKYVMGIMNKLELTEAGDGIFRATIRRSPAPTVVEMDIHEVPEEFVKVELKLKKSDVLDHIKKTEGEIPPGVEIKHGSYLHIK